MKKTKNNLILILSILFLIVTVVFFVYFLNVIKNKNKHISAVLTSLEEKKLEKENIKVLEDRMTEIVDTQKRIDGYLVSTSNIDFFVEYLEEIGLTNKVDLSVRSVDVPKNEKNKILVNLSASGDFPDVVKVIALLEHSPYNINMTSLYLNKETIPYTNSKKQISSKTFWKADLSFNVLSL